jgi:lysophospholipase L1-like esterase
MLSRRTSSRAVTTALAALASSALVLTGTIATTAASAAPAEPVAAQSTTPTPTPERLGMPGSIAVLGDSISQGTGADNGGGPTAGDGGGIGSPRPRNSWATGDWPGLNSYLQRTRALEGGASTVGINLSANGANMRNDFLNQARSVPAGTGLVLIQMGGNDLCRPSLGDMTSVAEYRAQLRAGLQWLQDNRPDTLVAAYSVPDIYNLWYLRGAAHQGERFGLFGQTTAAGPRPARGSQDNSPALARFLWDSFIGSVIPCRSLLEDPTNPRNAGPTPTPSHPSEVRRLAVRERAQAFNAVLEEECSAVLRCRFDDNAIFDFASNRVNGSLTGTTSLWRFVDRDISTQDHFHPSFAGQQKLADEAFRAGFDFTDRTPPSLTATTEPSPNAAGWNRTDVTVTPAATDDVAVRGYEHRVHGPDGSVGAWQDTIGASGPAVTVTVEGVSHVEVRAMDVNGNLSASSVVPVRVDRTHPQTEPVSPADGAVFVQNEEVTAAYTCSDAGGSELVACEGTVPDGALIDTSTVGEKTFTVRAVDAAGNERTTTRTYTVVDVTPPGITITTPANGAAVERRATIPADYTCVDEEGGSGLASCVGTVPAGTDIPTDTIGVQQFTVDATDNAGNADSLTHTYTVLDVTAPTITLTTPLDGARYEHRSQVLADYRCEDDDGGSGIAPGYCEGTTDDGAPIDTSRLGLHTFTVTATDRAGNTDTTTVTYEVIDVTAPTVSSPHAGIEYQLGQPVEALFTCTDEDGGSGVATCVGPQTLDTSTIGARTFDVTTTDAAGNSRTETIAYRVIYAYGEIREPINKDGTSVFKAGSTIPVRFALTDYAGNGTGGATVTLGTIRTYDIHGTVDPAELEQEAVASGAANTDNLFRSSAGGTYAYNLSTKGMKPGSYMLYIRLDDGKQYTAVFTLR